MIEDEIAGRQKLLELGQALMAWKRQALATYAALPVDSLARSTIDCVLLDSVDPAIRDLVHASEWQPILQKVGDEPEAEEGQACEASAGEPEKGDEL
jgi:hypothetical protein